VRLTRGLGRNVVGLGAASFFTDLAAEMITPLIPLFLEKKFGAGKLILGAIEGTADSVASLLRLVSGWFSDKVRKRKFLILIGYGFSVVARPLMALVAAVWHVATLRFLDRFGKGIRLAPRDALIADSCDPEVRGKAFGLQRAMDNLGGFLGMLVAAALLAVFNDDFQKVFLVTAIPAAAVILVIALVVRDKPPTAAPAKLQVSFKPFGPEFNWFLVTVTVFTLGNSTDLFLLWRLKELGLAPKWVLLAWSGHTLIRMILALPAGMLADRIGKKPLVFTGWIAYVAVYAGFAFTTSLATALALVALYAVYWSFAESVLRAIVADLVPERLRGTAYGMYWFCVGIAILPANLAFGLLWDRVGIRTAFLASAGLALAATLMLVRIPASRRPAAP
jgi:MFS family permease